MINTHTLDIGYSQISHGVVTGDSMFFVLKECDFQHVAVPLTFTPPPPAGENLLVIINYECQKSTQGIKLKIIV